MGKQLAILRLVVASLESRRHLGVSLFMRLLRMVVFFALTMVVNHGGH
jgi:hypothetical protein